MDHGLWESLEFLSEPLGLLLLRLSLLSPELLLLFLELSYVVSLSPLLSLGLHSRLLLGLSLLPDLSLSLFSLFFGHSFEHLLSLPSSLQLGLIYHLHIAISLSLASSAFFVLFVLV